MTTIHPPLLAKLLAKLTIMGMSKLLTLGALASTASGEHLNVP